SRTEIVRRDKARHGGVDEGRFVGREELQGASVGRCVTGTRHPGNAAGDGSRVRARTGIDGEQGGAREKNGTSPQGVGHARNTPSTSMNEVATDRYMARLRPAQICPASNDGPHVPL